MYQNGIKKLELLCHFSSSKYSPFTRFVMRICAHQFSNKQIGNISPSIPQTRLLNYFWYQRVVSILLLNDPLMIIDDPILN